MTVTVFGLGFVGLTTALGFAHYGIKTYGIDINKEKIEALSNAQLPFLEPNLDKVLNETLNKSFFITDDVAKAVGESDCIFYCVGTPYGENGSADLSFLFKAIDETLTAINDKRYRVLTVKSTIPPSTTSEKIDPYIKANYSHLTAQTSIANNPEFLREGHCWDDFINADRIVLGCSDEKSAKTLTELYKVFNLPIIKVSHNTGEFIKYLSNTLLATMISYSNEMSLIADTFGNIDVSSAFKVLHMDRRWDSCQMSSYVYPGCGYGGYCLPKDTNALYAQTVEKGFTPGILKNVIKLNNEMPQNIARRIAKGLDKSSRIGILGLAFKPQTDDVRDTPAARVIAELINFGFKNILAFDPVANKLFENAYNYDINYYDSVKELYLKSDVIVILTAWEEFKIVPQLGDKQVIDCRYML